MIAGMPVFASVAVSARLDGGPSITAGAANELIIYKGRYAKNYDSDQINLKTARATSLHQWGDDTSQDRSHSQKRLS